MVHLYKGYIANTLSENPHNLKWFVYAKRSVKKMECFYSMIDDFVTELQELEGDKQLGGGETEKVSIRIKYEYQ